jgi:hypothetical protein
MAANPDPEMSTTVFTLWVVQGNDETERSGRPTTSGSPNDVVRPLSLQ